MRLLEIRSRSDGEDHDELVVRFRVTDHEWEEFEFYAKKKGHFSPTRALESTFREIIKYKSLNFGRQEDFLLNRNNLNDRILFAKSLCVIIVFLIAVNLFVDIFWKTRLQNVIVPMALYGIGMMLTMASLLGQLAIDQLAYDRVSGDVSSFPFCRRVAIWIARTSLATYGIAVSCVVLALIVRVGVLFV